MASAQLPPQTERAELFWGSKCPNGLAGHATRIAKTGTAEKIWRKRSYRLNMKEEKSLTCTPIHPGKMLADELEETGLSAKRLADVLSVSPNRVYQILAGQRNVTADTALRLSQYLGLRLRTRLGA